jgi:nicotinamide mononucleotide transporter
MVTGWLSANFIELFGAVTGIVYVILEIRRNIWLWPLGIITSAVYMYVFASNGFYANMGLQGYYLVISVYGWYAWRRIQGAEHEIELSSSGVTEKGNPPSAPPGENPGNIAGPSVQERVTDVRRVGRATAVWCALAALVTWVALWFLLDRATDSPVPLWDGLIASLSVVATWMLTRKYLEQWYVWIVANAIAVAVYLAAGLYPTAVLFFVYFVMAIIGLREWARVRVRGSSERN